MPPSVTDSAAAPPAPSVSARPDGSSVELVLAGEWMVGRRVMGLEDAMGAIEALPQGGTVRFRADEVRRWDSSFVAFLMRLDETARERDIQVSPEGLPQGARRLLALAEAVPERPDVQRETEERDFVERLGEA